MTLVDEGGVKGVTGMGWALFFNRKKGAASAHAARRGIGLQRLACQALGSLPRRVRAVARLDARALNVNGHEAMLLYLLKSKEAWHALSASSKARLAALRASHGVGGFMASLPAPATESAACDSMGSQLSTTQPTSRAQATVAGPMWPDLSVMDELHATLRVRPKRAARRVVLILR